MYRLHDRVMTLDALQFNTKRALVMTIIIIIIMRSLSAPSQLSQRRVQQTFKQKDAVPGTKNSHAAYTNVSLTSPSLHLHTHTHTCTCTHTCTHTHTHTHTHMFTYAHT